MVIGLLTGHKVTVTGLEELIAPSAEEEMTDLTTRTDVLTGLLLQALDQLTTAGNTITPDGTITRQNSFKLLAKEMNVRP